MQTERAAEKLIETYRPLFLRNFPIVSTDLLLAKMIKYAANAFLTAKITFINKLNALCGCRVRLKLFVIEHTLGKLY